MKVPVHEFKNFVHYVNDYRPPYWSFDGRPCWLASGIKDINDVEIFEGDRVIFGEHERCGIVVFKDAMFKIEFSTDDARRDYALLGQCHGFVDVEVIGHIAEDNQ